MIAGRKMLMDSTETFDSTECGVSDAGGAEVWGKYILYAVSMEETLEADDGPDEAVM